MEGQASEGSIARTEGGVPKGKPKALTVHRYVPVLWMTQPRA
jgi:hypothetical protein